MLRTMCRIVLGVLLLAAVFCIGVNRASAQVVQNCCNFRIIVSPSVPAWCLPISITTNWGAGGGVTQTDVVATTGPGNPPLPIAAACPPPPVYNWVSFNGGATTFPGLGKSLCSTICSGVQFNVVRNTVTGCIEIYVNTCP